MSNEHRHDDEYPPPLGLAAFTEGHPVKAQAARVRGYPRLIGGLLAGGLWLLAATWRVEGADAVRLELRKRTGAPLLVGFWHGKFFPLFGLLRQTHAHVFIGEGFRGTLIATICRAFGYSPILLPHGDRDQAIERMRAALAQLVPCATAFDGPVGPPRHVKPSLIALASEAGASILPISVSARPRCVLRWRWDLREIPWPFARVRLSVGRPIELPVGLSQAEQADWAQRVKSALDELDPDSSETALANWTGPKKLVTLVVGGTILACGVAMLVLPGPALLVIPLGILILANEFEWARRLRRRLRSFTQKRRKGRSER